MKTIYVPRTAGLFDLHIGPGDVVGITVRVSDSIDDDVAIVAVNPDGSAEIVWRTNGDTYRNRDDQWWNDLCDAAVKAVSA